MKTYYIKPTCKVDAICSYLVMQQATMERTGDPSDQKTEKPGGFSVPGRKLYI